MNKKPEDVQTSQIGEGGESVEQTIWTVKVGSQTLYKTHLKGKTRLDNMSVEENKRVEEILGKAIKDIAMLLKDRTIISSATEETEEASEVYEETSDVNEEEVVEEKNETSIAEAPLDPQSRVARGPGGKFVSKKSPKKTDDESKPKSEKSSFLKRLIS